LHSLISNDYFFDSRTYDDIRRIAIGRGDNAVFVSEEDFLEDEAGLESKKKQILAILNKYGITRSNGTDDVDEENSVTE
jgi:hypothetical protein